MEVENSFLLDLVQQYGNYFLEAGFSAYFLPETQISLRAVEYDKGIILELFFLKNKDRRDFSDTTRRPVPLLNVTSIDQAFKELTIEISDFVSGKQNQKLTEAIEQDKSYFAGTVVFYDVENHKIYLIKEKKKELWNKEAAQYDLDRMIREMKSFAS